MATEMKRISISLPEEIDNQVIQMKKTDEYCRCSYAEIVRLLIEEGIRANHANRQTANFYSGNEQSA